MVYFFRPRRSLSHLLCPKFYPDDSCTLRRKQESQYAGYITRICSALHKRKWNAPQQAVIPITVRTGRHTGSFLRCLAPSLYSEHGALYPTGPTYIVLQTVPSLRLTHTVTQMARPHCRLANWLAVLGSHCRDTTQTYSGL